jgi:hypothetical protein
MFSKIAIVAVFTGLAAAQHAPVGPEPVGNPVSRPLTEIVPACKPFTITWTPTTPNSLSIILRKGPPENNVPFGAPIVVGIPNSGSYTWTPPSSLEASNGPNGYGIQLIDDINGQYQYSNNFGISKGPECDAYVTPTPSSSQYGGGYPVSTPAPSSKASASPSSHVVSSTVVIHTSASGVHSSKAYSTGMPINSTMIVQPTKPITLPSSLSSGTATGAASQSSAPAQQTANAASGFQAGLGMVGAAAAFAFMI